MKQEKSNLEIKEIEEEIAIQGIVSPVCPFPPVSWWMTVCKVKKVQFDGYEHFRKMSLRNRYYLAGPSGKHLMSIPLIKGRGQRTIMKEVRMDHRSHWAIKHWRTVQSFYGRAPFFEFYEEEIRALFLQAEDTDSLMDWCLLGINRIRNLLQEPVTIRQTTHFERIYPDGYLDFRLNMPENPKIRYHQVFISQNGFIPNCSILDLIFCQNIQFFLSTQNNSKGSE